MTLSFRNMTFTVLCVLFAAGTAKTADAAVIGQDLGTAAPPATLGGYAMTPFGADPTPNFTGVTSVASPLGGGVGFSSTVNKRTVGGGWATWSHGYTGDIYFLVSGTSLTLTLPSLTKAFYFYAQPNVFGIFSFTVTDESGIEFTKLINGDSGANGFGFWGVGATTLSSITVSTIAGADGFALGEFGVAIAPIPLPAGGFLLLTALGGAAALRRRKKAA